ncbi:MAG: HD domain-containing phosphohydrolase [Candidatus Xenobiia bacterium LiM19]
MPNNDNENSSSPVALSDILEIPAIKKFQRALLEKLSLNVAVVNRNNRILSLSTRISNRLTTLFFEKVLSCSDTGEFDTTLFFPIDETVIMVFYPITIQNERLGMLIAGPVVKDRLQGPEIESLARRYDFSPGEMKKILEHSPLIENDELRMAQSLIESYGDLINQYYTDKLASLKHLQEISALYKVVKSLNSSLSLKEVLGKVLQSSTELLGASNGSIMLVEADSPCLKIFVAYGLDEDIIKNTRVQIGEGISGKVAQTGISELIMKEDRRSTSAGKRRKNQSSSICVPLSVQGQNFGVLNISESIDKKNFTRKDMEFLEIIASSAAVAINNAKLYEGLRKKVQEQATLLYIGNAISSSLNPDTVLQEVLDKSIKLLDAQKGSLMLIDEDTHELRIANACGLSWDIINNTRIKIGEGIAGSVAAEGLPLLLRKGEKVAQSQSNKRFEQLYSAVSVPVTIKDKVIGVLNISDHVKGEDFTKEHVALLQMFATQAAIAIENSRLHRELKELFVGSVKALINAIEARDPYTKGHSIRVTHYSSKIAQALKMDQEEIDNIQYAALLHDIGKIKVQDEILLKQGKLTKEERLEIQEHPSYGAIIMKPVKAFQRILPFLYYHHEMYAGSGYPQKLKGDSIPVESRIIAVADSFDAMTSDRPYRNALSIDEALNELQINSGTQFDPQIVDVFVKLVRTDKTCNPRFAEESPII